MANVLVIGHSHVAAIRAAAARRRETGRGRLRVRTIHLLDPAFGGEFAPGSEGRTFSEGVRAAILDQIARHQPFVASVLCGNMHTVLSLVERDRPFDFALAGEPSPKLNARARIYPEKVIYAWLKRAMRVDLDRLTLLRELIGPFSQLESPPPVAARSFIERRAESFFRDMPEFDRNGIAPGGVRYRMWRLSSRIMADHCARIGCAYLPSPQSAEDDHGFLGQQFSADSTHGNEIYGEAVIASLEAGLIRPAGLHATDNPAR